MEDATEALEQFPPNLEAAYLQTWMCIQRQMSRHAELANCALLWVIHAREGFGVETVRRMASTSPETHTFDPGQMAPPTREGEFGNGIHAAIAHCIFGR